MQVFNRTQVLLFTNIPQCLKPCLRTVSISCFRWCVEDAQFLKYLLKHANRSEKVTLFCLSGVERNLKKQKKLCSKLQAIHNCVIEFHLWERNIVW